MVTPTFHVQLFYSHLVDMSLFQFGFIRASSSCCDSSQEERVPVPAHMPTQEESGLGIVEYNSTMSSVSELCDPTTTKKRRQRGTYTHYTPSDRAKIGKYALENGNLKAMRHFSASSYPDIKESTIRNFKRAYKERLDSERKQQNPAPVTEIPSKHRGRPPLLLQVDGKLIVFLKAIRKRGGVVNSNIVRATAKALIASAESGTIKENLSKINLPRSWVQSIYRRMKFSARMATTSRPPVPPGLYNECRTHFLRCVDKTIKKYAIPPELVLNSDQTPSSYVSVGRSTMASRGAKTVAIKGYTDKRNITLNFVVTLAGEFLPMQIIYKGKTEASQPRGVKFPSGFLVTQNPKHWSNEAETLNLIEKIINPYVVRKRANLNLPADQKALIVWDVFKGQMTQPVLDKLESLNLELVPVPANMTHFFQPLDLTVNGSAKKFLRARFTEYYADSVREQIDNGKQLEDIDVDFRLSVIKPLHAKWLIALYNYLTTNKGMEIIAKGWKKAGIIGLLDGTTVLPPEDPFSSCYSQ